MTCDIVLAGVGGQGVLSLAALIARAAEGLHVKQSEVHGMSQRGGAVVAHLRLSDQAIHSDLIPLGRAALILGLEPLEALRYVEYLSPSGRIVTATSSVRNIPDYPDLETLVTWIRALPQARLVDADRLARAAGAPAASNVVLLGAAADLLPIERDRIVDAIANVFRRHGPAIARVNLRAFEAGCDAVTGASHADRLEEDCTTAR